jgi:anti-sigma-K factor RskA
MSDDMAGDVTGDEELRALIALAAVHALEPDEERELHAALAQRPDLAAELDDLRDAAATMALAVAETPPPSVRAAVLAAIAAEAAAADREGPGEDDAGRHPASPAPPAPPAGVTSLSSRRWRNVLLAAAAVVVVVASATVATRVLDDDRADEIAAVLDDDGAVTLILTGDIGQLDVVYSPATQRAVMIGEDVATLGDDEVYELWTQPAGSDEMEPVGTFRPDDDGIVESLMTDIELSPTAVFAVTVEPAGGSEVPTLPTVAVST